MRLNKIQKEYIDNKINNLSKSKFRSSFHLRKYMLDYIDKVGLEAIEEHATYFINNRIAPYPTPNDGAQTPMKAHPVFIAQHATATCCRSCLYKWYKIPKTRSLSEKEIRFIIALIVEWINKEYSQKKGLIK